MTNKYEVQDIAIQKLNAEAYEFISIKIWHYKVAHVDIKFIKIAIHASGFVFS